MVTLYLNTFLNVTFFFMQTLLFLIIVSVFLFEFYNRITIRFIFWGITISILIDLIWFVLTARNVWQID